LNALTIRGDSLIAIAGGAPSVAGLPLQFRPPPTQVMAMSFDSNSSANDSSGNGDQQSTGNTPISGTEQPYRDARTFRDLAGTLWIVHEVAGDALGGGPQSLLLVSAQQVRRVSSYPAEWASLSPRALLELPHTSL